MASSPRGAVFLKAVPQARDTTPRAQIPFAAGESGLLFRNAR
jgi:hypothetical protein